MIEEKLVIGFEEYISLFSEDIAAFHRCNDEIKNTINNFLSGATTITHQGLSLYGTDFNVRLDVSLANSDDEDLISLYIDNAFGVSAKFRFDATLKLEMTKTNNCVVIDSRML